MHLRPIDEIAAELGLSPGSYVPFGEGVAKLRLVLVRPEARGIGLGAQLTDRCLAFAREKGYQRMVLWTNANLLAARALYARRGFRLTASEPYHGYGHDLVSETWELRL